jgi:hypothetical protein
LNEIAAEQNATIVFPLPTDLFGVLRDPAGRSAMLSSCGR